jgi:CheY-like chemotaxis protein
VARIRIVARIVVIDDQEPVRRVIARVLQAAGHDVLEAGDGAAGMRILESHPVDVVITDIFMPGQDGILTLRQIRKQFPGVKVITMSGGDVTGRLNLSQEAEMLGAVMTVAKPFKATEIVEAVRSVLGE